MVTGALSNHRYANLLLKYTIFNHCNLKCMVIMLSNIERWNLKFGEKESRGGSSCTTATNLEIMAQPTGQMGRGVKVIEVSYPVPGMRQLSKQMVYHSPRCYKAFDR